MAACPSQCGHQGGSCHGLLRGHQVPALSSYRTGSLCEGQHRDLPPGTPGQLGSCHISPRLWRGLTWACRFGSKRSKHPIWVVFVWMIPAPTKLAGLGSTSSSSAEPNPMICPREVGCQGVAWPGVASVPQSAARTTTLALVISVSIGCLALKMFCTSCCGLQDGGQGCVTESICPQDHPSLPGDHPHPQDHPLPTTPSLPRDHPPPPPGWPQAASPHLLSCFQRWKKSCDPISVGWKNLLRVTGNFTDRFWNVPPYL